MEDYDDEEEDEDEEDRSGWSDLAVVGIPGLKSMAEIYWPLSANA